MYRTFRRLGAQSAEAEDLTQEVFAIAWRRRDSYKPDRPVRSWLIGIAHKVAIAHFRKVWRQQPAGVLDREDEGPGPDEQLSSARARHLAQQALATLPEDHRLILSWHDLDGTAIREIADELSVPFFTAASRLRRARRKFAQAVKRLQRQQQAKRATVLTAAAVLQAERAAPALSPRARARLLAALPNGALAGPPSTQPDPGGPATPASSAPFISAAAAVAVLGCLLAVLLLVRGQRNRDVSGAAARTDVASEGSIPPRSLAPPRLVPASLPAPAAEVRPERPEPAPPAHGPMAHWRFDDGPGSELARDSSGNGFHCQLRDLDPATAWVSGPVGGAIDLGRKGWLECPLPEARAGVPFDVSAAVWMKRLRPNHHSALLSRQLANDERFHFWFGLRDDLLAVHGDAWKGWTSRTLTSFDDWTHVAFVRAASETRLYIDGVLVRHNVDQPTLGAGAVRSPLIIGRARRYADSRVTHHFDGLVDEAMIYDRALTAAEVATLARR